VRVAARRQVSHRARPEIDRRTPVHVTLRMLPEIARLRRRDQYRAIREALARTAEREDCRICQFSIQANHVHLTVEPGGKGGLARG
jgi:REP element-mobilizing transposase RayT